MGRWEPDAERRLRVAALELFEEQGFEETTVAQIAERAGLTARTFFRYFADKREVLFGGADLLRRAMTDALAAVPADRTPIDAVAAAVEAGGAALGVDRAAARRRSRVVLAHADLRERELVKLASLADALTDGLVHRGVEPTAARLAAETGVTVFRVAFDRWCAAKRGPKLVDEIAAGFGTLRSLTAG